MTSLKSLCLPKGLKEKEYMMKWNDVYNKPQIWNPNLAQNLLKNIDNFPHPMSASESASSLNFKWATSINSGSLFVIMWMNFCILVYILLNPANNLGYGHREAGVFAVAQQQIECCH